MKDILEFESVRSGLCIQDEDGYVGMITSIEDIHNIHIDLDNGGSGIYCMDPTCQYYNKLYHAKEK